MEPLLPLYALAEQFAEAVRVQGSVDVDEATARDTLESVQLPFNAKAENIARYIRTLDSNIAALQARADETAARVGALTKRQEWLKNYLLHEMMVAHVDEIPCPLFTIKVRQASSPRVVMTGDVPDEFLSKKEEIRPDLAGIKQALMAGQELPFAYLERGHWLSIR